MTCSKDSNDEGVKVCVLHAFTPSFLFSFIVKHTQGGRKHENDRKTYIGLRVSMCIIS